MASSADDLQLADPRNFPAVPGYEILGLLGRGGMGVVYQARQQSLDRLVAFKVISTRLLNQRGILERFRREALAAARLHHPNIVLIYHAGQHEDLQYLVMEYMDGLTLDRLVRTSGSLAVERAAEYARQTALGLQHAHEKGLIHRDVKPANLMVTRVDPTVKILDMGLARFQGAPQADGAAEAAAALETQFGVFVGSVDWAAPEQGLDARSVDARADLYSLGCTLYFLLTGRVPLPRGGTLEKLDQHRFATPRPVAELRPDVPSGLAGVVTRLLAKHPDERYQTAGEVIAALAPFTLPPPRPRSSFPAPAPPTPPEPPTTAAAAPPAEMAAAEVAAAPGLGVPPSSPEAQPLGEIACWAGHEGWVRSVAFSPDGRRVYSASRDGTVRGWEVATGAQVLCLAGSPQGLVCLAVSPTGEELLTADAERRVQLWDLAAGQVREPRWPKLHADVLCVALSGNGRFALTGGADGRVRLWEVATAHEVRRFEGHADEVWCVAFSPDSSQVLSGGRDHTLRLWDVATGREAASVGNWLGGGQRKTVTTSVAFSPHGRRVLSGGSDHVVLLWEVQPGRRLAKFAGHRGWVYSVAFAPDGQTFLSGGGDKTLRLWDCASGREAICFTGHTDRVTSVAYSPDGCLAATGSSDRTVRLWRLPT